MMAFLRHFRASLPLIILIAAPAPSSGFAVPAGAAARPRRPDPVVAVAAAPAGHPPATTRRDFLGRSALVPAAAVAAAVANPLPAGAKEAPPPPTTRLMVTETFSVIRDELTSPTGVVSKLTALIDNGSFEEIILYTRESDAYFRRAKMGKARKLMTDKVLKGEALSMCNAVTFDLIGINRASRPGKEDREEQLKYLGELKTDIEKFLELEGTIDVVEE